MEVKKVWISLFSSSLIYRISPSFDLIFRQIISGGGEGAIRVWNLDLSNTKKPIPTLLETMKEHKSKITAIKVSS